MKNLLWYGKYRLGFKEKKDMDVVKSLIVPSSTDFKKNNAEFIALLRDIKINVVAPASGISNEWLSRLKDINSLKLNIPNNCFDGKKSVLHSNSDEMRYKCLENALLDDSTNVIWSLRGGDITALHIFLTQEWGWKTIHGSGISEILKIDKDPQNFLKIAQIISGEKSVATITGLLPLNSQASFSNLITGNLTGGNLTLVEDSLGTDWQINSADKILFLEDVGIKPYQLDRSLYHLQQAGIFKQMNVYDSLKMQDLLDPFGYKPTDSMQQADMIILNTCHIREKAAEKMYSELGRIKKIKDEKKLKSCVSQAEGDEIFRRAPYVDIVVGPQSYYELPELVAKIARHEKQLIKLDFVEEAKFDNLPEQANSQGSSALISIQEGCDKFCTFCVVPYTRGAEFSRSLEQIYRETVKSVTIGAKEVIFLGQNVNAYHGKGPGDTVNSLADLIKHIAKIQKLERIRYVTSHPLDMTEELMLLHGSEAKLMPFLHLPVQSGSDKILKAMNRKHSRDYYFGIINRLRDIRSDMVFSSDFIVGFPGETEEDFADTLDLVKRVGYGQCYSFKYSPRPGTPAAVKEQVPEEIKSKRLAILQAELSKQQLEFNENCVGRTMKVLFDRTGKYENQLIVIGFGSTIFLLYYYSRDLPDYSQLANYYPPSVTRIYSRDGKLIEEYALERRVFVPINNIPRSLIEAFIAVEDKNFYDHPGVDIISILRAAILNISNILRHRRVEGGSTITQQVVKNFLLTAEVSVERKIKEAILSYRISQVFTKDQILELYLNQTFFGKGAYGIAMAAQNYFNKSVDDLTIAESAFIAGLPKAPSSFNPTKNYARVKGRRDYVIMRMLEEGYIQEETAVEAINTPITFKQRDRNETVKADYYAEQVREEKAAENALRKGIRDYDKKQGFRGKITTININDWQQNLKQVTRPLGLLEYQLAVVINTLDAYVEIGLQDGSKSKILLSEMKWATSKLKSATTLLKPGDVIVVEQLNSGYALRQIPVVNGGIMVMNPTTGQVLASVGGYDFAVSKFDRVVQASRQPGSLSKTFVYLAALENAVPPNKIFEDGPVEIYQGPGMPVWRPKNYKGNFLGVAQTIGLNKVAEIIKRFNINSEPKKVYSMVLGSLETTLEKMTSAYATIANSGNKVTPHFVELIKDRNGKIIYRRDNRECSNCIVGDPYLSEANSPIISAPSNYMVTDEASNYQIISFLAGAVERGTAVAAKKLAKIIAGKSGTTNESKDTWFVGFTPKIVVGTYIGYDTPRTLGKSATGSNVALPIFIDFMENAYSNVPSLAFKVPDTIKLLPVDSKTGKIISSSNVMEAFKINDIPPIDELPANDIFHNIQPEKDASQEIY
ncbi:Penicillin-binding protein 1A [Pseudolycoriella hygida]|uniref:Penicillin-binding protein 1A n=1 Tax=Pseudolycoriella hygida TaxID=35572 RepID=A0A9Q0N7D4_9DIPT|nr:Penicillin-binding protein 1A [Pseudolycoriella hygida]